MCIEKGSNFIFNQAVLIVQNEEATSSKVSCMQPEYGSKTSQATVNKLDNHNKGTKRDLPSTRNRDNPRRNSVIPVEPLHPISEMSSKESDMLHI